MERTQISLSDELIKMLEKEEQAKGISRSEVIRYILFQYFDAKVDKNE